MAQKRNYPVAVITAKAERSLRAGHPWVYSDEILSIDESYENGDIVDVFSTKNRYLGSGFINDNSKIRIRIVSKNANALSFISHIGSATLYGLGFSALNIGSQFSTP